MKELSPGQVCVVRVFMGLLWAMAATGCAPRATESAEPKAPAAALPAAPPVQPPATDSVVDSTTAPRADVDRDGIADATDACPNEAEDQRGATPADGCPVPRKQGYGDAKVTATLVRG